jgi:hypothetical protein
MKSVDRAKNLARETAATAVVEEFSRCGAFHRFSPYGVERWNGGKPGDP